jgi:predicted nuclease with TOPRIM domain
MRNSPLIKVFDGDKLVHLELRQNVASDPIPDKFELEILRIFNESKQKNEEIKKLNETSDGLVDMLKNAVEKVKELQTKLDRFEMFLKLEVDNANAFSDFYDNDKTLVKRIEVFLKRAGRKWKT